MTNISDREIMNVLRDVLRENLEDPLAQYSSTSRQFIHTDESLPTATYPRVQIEKRETTIIKNQSVGFEYWEERTLPLAIWFKTKTGFKWNLSGVNLQNDELVKEYTEKITRILKQKHQWVHDNYKFYIRLTGITEPEQFEEFNMYYGSVLVNCIYYVK